MKDLTSFLTSSLLHPTLTNLLNFYTEDMECKWHGNPLKKKKETIPKNHHHKYLLINEAWTWRDNFDRILFQVWLHSLESHVLHKKHITYLVIQLSDTTKGVSSLPNNFQSYLSCLPGGTTEQLNPSLCILSIFISLKLLERLSSNRCNIYIY